MRKKDTIVGQGGETHQQAKHKDPLLTTAQGVPISDNQNTLRIGPRGPCNGPQK